MIDIVDLYKTFPMGGRELVVLNNINLRIQRGELIAIMGASGAGKSTLLQILGTLDRPTKGTVSFDGQNLFQLTEQQQAEFRNKRVGFVFQFHHLLPEFTAEENITLPQLADGRPARVARERARMLLDRVGLADRAGHRPAALSGGEQQRVAFCRALANGPKLLLADEPTGNLDPATSDQVFGVLMDLVRATGLSALIATHNLELAARMDRVVRLDAGRVVTA